MKPLRGAAREPTVSDISEDSSTLERTEAAVRARRLVQISGLTMAGMGVIAVRAMTYQRWLEVAALAAGIVTLLLCQAMNRRGATEAANLLLVVALTVMVSLLMWNGEGLRDSALLAFPAVLIVAGLLTRPRHMVRLVIAMLLGGVLAAPLAAYVIRFLPPRGLGLAVATLLMFTNIRELAGWADLGAVRWVLYALVPILVTIGALRPRWSKTATDNDATDGAER